MESKPAKIKILPHSNRAARMAQILLDVLGKKPGGMSEAIWQFLSKDRLQYVNICYRIDTFEFTSTTPKEWREWWQMHQSGDYEAAFKLYDSMPIVLAESLIYLITDEMKAQHKEYVPVYQRPVPTLSEDELKELEKVDSPLASIGENGKRNTLTNSSGSKNGDTKKSESTEASKPMLTGTGN